jgi:hypothetical protein
MGLSSPHRIPLTPFLHSSFQNLGHLGAKYDQFAQADPSAEARVKASAYAALARAGEEAGGEDEEAAAGAAGAAVDVGGVGVELVEKEAAT